MRKHAKKKPLPRWPADHASSAHRVLIEDADGATAWATERALHDAGYVAVWCPGPTGIRGGCPLLRNQRCSVADEADVVVVALPFSEQVTRDVLTAHRLSRRPDSLCVQVAHPEAERFAATLAGCQLIPITSSAPTLLQRVRRAVTTSPATAR